MQTPRQRQKQGQGPAKAQARLTLTGSTNGLRQLTKELPSDPSVAVMQVESIMPGLTPTPDRLYSHMPTSSLYRLTTPSSLVPVHTCGPLTTASAVEERSTAFR